MRNIKLRYRIVIWMVALESILLLVFAGVFLAVIQRKQNQQVNETLRLSASELNAVVDVQAGQYTAGTAETAAIRARGVMAWVLSPDGQVVLTVGNAENYALPDILPPLHQTVDILLAKDEQVRLYAAPLSEGEKQLGELILAFPLQSNANFLRQIYLGLGVAIPLGLLFSAFGGLLLAQRALQPVATITQTARQIGASDLGERIALDLPEDEIGELAQTFNAMLERLEMAFYRERQFTSDVSHELRTPLSLLKTQLSLARARPRDAATLLEMMRGMEKDVDRMTALVEEMLALARAEQPDALTRHSVPVSSLLTEIFDEWLPIAKERGIRILPDIQDGCFIYGSETHLRRLITNLLDNAIKHTPPEGRITIHVWQTESSVSIFIEDTGTGIAPEHLPHLFERFYRVDQARTRQSGGAGLGLAIAKAIVQQHRGEIQISSAEGQGTIIQLTFPRRLAE